MKVLIINQHVSDVLGGSEMQCDLIARGLSGRGHQVVYGAVRKRKDSYPGLPYRVVPLAIERRGELAGLLRRERPDVIYWRIHKRHLLQAVRESRREGVPLVFAVSHVNDVTRFPLIPRRDLPGAVPRISAMVRTARHWITSAWNYRGFRHVAAVTTLNSQFLGKLPVENQRVIWNGVSPRSEPFTWDRPFCIWVANIKPAKQPELFIRLAGVMADRCPGTDFLMIGAVQDEQYRAVIQLAGEMPNFHYLGPRAPEMVNGALEKAICLVHTCKPEGFGNNFIQAWMQGCPTVTLGFDPDWLIMREGLGFVSGTMDRLIHDVESLIHDRALRDSIGDRARAFGHANFSPERMVGELEMFLREVIDAHHR